MTVTEQVERYDAQRALAVSGLLSEFNLAGVLSAADLHVATTLGRLAKETDGRVLLAVAFCVRAVRAGSVCIDLAGVADTAGADVDTSLHWPAVAEWYDALRNSPLVAVGRDGDPSRPVRLIDELVYLDRYWRQEEVVRAELTARVARDLRSLDSDALVAAINAVLPADELNRHQRLAAAACALGSVTIITGGPGTGKTTVIKAMLDVLERTWPAKPRIALAAPTAKAAARMAEAVGRDASTLHRLLGSKPGSRTRFRHDVSNRLPFDVVVVDETSMVSLTLMSRLLEAVRPDASLVLVGDPDQLASVEAGAVLGDLVGRPPRQGADERAARLRELLPAEFEPTAEIEAELGKDVVRLRHVYRHEGTIVALAEAIRAENPDADLIIDLLTRGAPDVQLIESADDALREDVESAGAALVTAAREGNVDAALTAMDSHRIICGHRRGDYGVQKWGSQVESWIAAAIDDYEVEGEWYVGRPLIATSNDYELGLFNGDTGVVVEFDGHGVQAAFSRGGSPLIRPTNRLSDVETVHALTVHRAQGSQFKRVTVVLPPVESPLLTRELLYTAITRAEDFVRIVGREDAVRAALAHPIRRASGLRR
jgi:exodeoxyribonuclease V alpha subunit